MGGRSTSPYRSTSKGTVNFGYSSGSTMLSEGGSRRASSSVSQVKSTLKDFAMCNYCKNTILFLTRPLAAKVCNIFGNV